MNFKPGDKVRYVGDDTLELASGVTGTVIEATSLVVKVSFHGDVQVVSADSLEASEPDN